MKLKFLAFVAKLLGIQFKVGGLPYGAAFDPAKDVCEIGTASGASREGV